MRFTLPPFPPGWSGWSELQPILSEEQVKAHYLLHHVKYVEQLNLAVDQLDFDPPSLGWLLQNLDKIGDPELVNAIAVNGGGHYNHTMFWTALHRPGITKSIPTDLADQLENSFGTLEDFDAVWLQSAQELTGSGYIWLVYTVGNTLEIQTTQNQENPLTLNSGIPICNIDVWEHSYYLDYIADRSTYMVQLLGCFNLAKVARRLRYAKALL